MFKKNLILILFTFNYTLAQNEVLPAQINAIKTLAYENGFTDEQLNNYLFPDIF